MMLYESISEIGLMNDPGYLQGQMSGSMLCKLAQAL